MNVLIKTLPEFDRRAKRLAKKYISLKEDLKSLVISLKANPTQGVNLGMGGVHKVRLAISSKGGGKSGGARILTYVLNEVAPEIFEVTLLTIYDKSEIENVNDAYIKSLVEEII